MATKILLTEDDDSIQKMYAFALNAAGFEVTLASSGAEALVRVKDQTFDVILLDMLMSGMSGLDLLRAYDVKTKSPHTKIIALTNMTSPRIEEKARELGVSEYLEKSAYEPQQLVEHIQKLIAAPDSKR